jgi:hypothetical protein
VRFDVSDARWVRQPVFGAGYARVLQTGKSTPRFLARPTDGPARACDGSRTRTPVDPAIATHIPVCVHRCDGRLLRAGSRCSDRDNAPMAAIAHRSAVASFGGHPEEGCCPPEHLPDRPARQTRLAQGIGGRRTPRPSSARRSSSTSAIDLNGSQSDGECELSVQ